MKKLLTIVPTAFALSANGDWTFHAHESVNPFVTFTTDGTYNNSVGFKYLHFQYGVDQSWPVMAFMDQWVGFELLEYQTTISTSTNSGSTLIYSGGLVFADAYIESPFHDFLGGDTFTGLTEGEYWMDVTPGGGHGRCSAAQPSDFGKWAWDGSVNPNYVEPLALKSRGKNHRK